MFARFDENPAMTLRVIMETKRYGRTDARTDARTDGQRENSIPPTNKVCGEYNDSTIDDTSSLSKFPNIGLYELIIFAKLSWSTTGRSR